jgi:transcription antitermination factor NusG
LTARWYALCSKPHKERVLWRQLKAKGYEVFYPKLCVPTSDPRGLKCRAYFPGYLFVKVDFERVSLSTFRWMPHTEGLVCIDGVPAFVPDRLIEAIQRHVERLNHASREFFDEADQAEVEETLKIGNGVFDPNLSETERVGALLRALNLMRAAPELSTR